jgi:hypothetical protein
MLRQGTSGTPPTTSIAQRRIYPDTTKTDTRTAARAAATTIRDPTRAASIEGILYLSILTAEGARRSRHNKYSSWKFEVATKGIDYGVIAHGRKDGDCLKCGKSCHASSDCWVKELNREVQSGSRSESNTKGGHDSRGSSLKKLKIAAATAAVSSEPGGSWTFPRTISKTSISISGDPGMSSSLIPMLVVFTFSAGDRLRRC